MGCISNPFKIATSVYLSQGTVGCGSICAISKVGELLAIGDGETSNTLEYNNAIATMYDLAEVNYNE